MHPRTRIERRWRVDLGRRVDGWLENNELTEAEELSVLISVMGDTIRRTLRTTVKEERSGSADGEKENQEEVEWGPGARSDFGDG